MRLISISVLESFKIHDIEAPQEPCKGTSGLNTSCLAFSHKARTDVIEKLICEFSLEGFIEDVVHVGEKLVDHRIAGARALELELICAGKVIYSIHYPPYNTDCHPASV